MPNVSPLVLEGAFFVVLLSILIVWGILILALRTRNLPECIACESPSVRAAQAKGIDSMARIVFLYPHRCNRCQHRFYCFRARNPAPKEP